MDISKYLQNTSSYINLVDAMNDADIVSIGITTQSGEFVNYLVSIASEEPQFPILVTNNFKDKELKIELIDKTSKYNFIKDKLNNIFTRVTHIPSEGEFLLRGDQIILKSSVYDYPVRIDFFGDDIERIILIDNFTNKVIDTLDKIYVTKVRLDIINKDKDYDKHKIIHINSEDVSCDKSLSFDFKSPRLFFSNAEVFEKDVNKMKEIGYEIFFNNLENRPEGTHPSSIHLSQGVVSERDRYAIYTKRELFSTLINKKKLAIDEFDRDINKGDYIVHIDHGIGIYDGIQSREVLGKEMSYLIISYADNDKLFIPYDQINKLSKYKAFGKAPSITKLNSRQWGKIKSKVKKSAKVFAKELMQLYAARHLAHRQSYESDRDILDDIFSKKFGYELTNDQQVALEEIVRDLKSNRPMDRLLVGDVGFGKTEVAMRVALIAVKNSKQVAVLVPTTILASQHYAVFKNRFEDLGVRVDFLSRLSSKANKQKVKELENGKIDIIIGTHRLLSKDVRYKSLGLLIIDEEQKFGVKQKEQITKIKSNVDVLSMSATPIPRTLYSSLVKIKDISVINTPIKGRKPIKTYVHEFDWEYLIGKIQAELARGGQVYLVHNEVITIDSMATKLQSMLKGTRIVVGHGQLDAGELETRMNKFYLGEYDILICTTIIQSGIDLPNVNTIIINKANRLGLSQLHQLRGRVGRSDRQAHCYLLYPVQKDIDKRFNVASKSTTQYDRLDVIKMYQGLGSGFDIATKDLELRGAGSLIGYSQSGNIEAVGLNLYIYLLEQEVKSLEKLETYINTNL